VFSSDIHQWFDPSMPFEKNSAARPGTFHVRVFPYAFDSLRADGIENLDVKILRSFELIREQRLRAHFSVDLLNAINHTNLAAPVTNPSNTNFGRVTSQRGLGRLIQANIRFVF
jgi:hypothetical protein